MSSDQVADFVCAHRQTVREFDFENVALINGGMWEDALAPLTRFSGSDEWQSQQSGSEVDSYMSSHSQAVLQQVEELEEVVDMSADAQRASVLVTKHRKKRGHRRRRRKHRIGGQLLEISNPIPISEPMAELLHSTTFNPGVQGVQRNVQRDEALQQLADDPDKRVSTLRKAKEAVLTKLSSSFKSHERNDSVRGFFNTCSGGRKGRALVGHESNTALVPLMFSRY